MRCDSETETCIKRDNFTRADITIRAVMNMISHVGSGPGNGKAGLRVSIQLSCQLQLVTDSVWLGAPLHHTVRNRSFTGYRPAYDINLIPLIHAGHYTKYPPHLPTLHHTAEPEITVGWRNSDPSKLDQMICGDKNRILISTPHRCPLSPRQERTD